MSGGRCRGSSATSFQFILITDCQPHPTVYRRWPSFSGRRCSRLNSLPDRVTSAPSVAVFRSRLKTHLFDISYPSPYDRTVPAQWRLVALDTIIVLTYLLTYFSSATGSKSADILGTFLKNVDTVDWRSRFCSWLSSMTTGEFFTCKQINYFADFIDESDATALLRIVGLRPISGIIRCQTTSKNCIRNCSAYSIQRANDVTHVRLASGHPTDYAAASGGRTSWLPFWKRDFMIKNATPSIDWYLVKNNPAKFYSDLIRNNGAVYEECRRLVAPSRPRTRRQGKLSSEGGQWLLFPAILLLSVLNFEFIII